MPVFDRHEVVVKKLPEGQRYTHETTCDCNWHGMADSEEAAVALGQQHQAARGYVPVPKSGSVKPNAVPAPKPNNPLARPTVTTNVQTQPTIVPPPAIKPPTETEKK
jgi:hypothetical protein